MLGALLTAPGLLDTLGLDPQDFYEPVHERIYMAMRECWSEHHAVDPIILKDELVREGDRLPEVGGLTYLGDLVAAAPVAGDAEAHAAIVKRCAAARRTLQALTQAQQRIESGADPADAMSALKSVDVPRSCTRRALVTLPGDVTITRPEFLKSDWYPVDVVTILAGRGGEGKSSLVIADVAAGTRGQLEGDRSGKLRALLTAPEDSKGLQAARLQAAGADPAGWGFLDIATDLAGDTVESAPRIPDDLNAIGDALADFHADMWVIDPITAVIPGDLNKRDVVRAGLDPLTRLARDLNIAIVTIMHFNKGGGYASDKLSGSAAFRDAARSVLLVAHDKESDERVITVDKSNYSDAQGKSWTFRLDTANVTADNGLLMDVPLAVVTGESDTTVEQIINRSPTTEDAGDQDDCASWLRNWAASEGGELDAGEVRKVVDGAGFSWSAAKRARAKLAMTTRREGFGKGSHNIWTLPVTDPDPHRARIEPIEPMPQEASPMGSMASPMGTKADPSDLPADWLMFPGKTICSVCGSDLLAQPSWKPSLCGDRHRVRGAA